MIAVGLMMMVNADVLEPRQRMQIAQKYSCQNYCKAAGVLVLLRLLLLTCVQTEISDATRVVVGLAGHHAKNKSKAQKA